MKFILFFTILAFAVACVLGEKKCEGNNKPTCDGDSGTKVRNFNDVSVYWECKGGEAASTRCPDEKCFDDAKGDCVPCEEFVWTCPEKA